MLNMSLDKARAIVIAINKDIKMIGVSDEMISKAFKISCNAGDFYLNDTLYEGVIKVRK
ncbi:MAG: hypothetical protein ACRCTZ_01225 [Sarcina sp.]